MLEVLLKVIRADMGLEESELQEVEVYVRGLDYCYERLSASASTEELSESFDEYGTDDEFDSDF